MKGVYSIEFGTKDQTFWMITIIKPLNSERWEKIFHRADCSPENACDWYSRQSGPDEFLEWMLSPE